MPSPVGDEGRGRERDCRRQADRCAQCDGEPDDGDCKQRQHNRLDRSYASSEKPKVAWHLPSMPVPKKIEGDVDAFGAAVSNRGTYRGREGIVPRSLLGHLDDEAVVVIAHRDRCDGCVIAVDVGEQWGSPRCLRPLLKGGLGEHVRTDIAGDEAELQQHEAGDRCKQKRPSAHALLALHRHTIIPPAWSASRPTVYHDPLKGRLLFCMWRLLLGGVRSTPRFGIA